MSSNKRLKKYEPIIHDEERLSLYPINIMIYGIFIKSMNLVFGPLVK